MSSQVVVTLSDELMERAKQWALLTQRDLAQTLVDALQIVLAPVQHTIGVQPDIAELSDQEVLSLCTVKLKPAQGKRINVLLAKQREEQLTPTDQSELLALMEIYNQLWIRQSEALAEAVRRGLRNA